MGGSFFFQLAPISNSQVPNSEQPNQALRGINSDANFNRHFKFLLFWLDILGSQCIMGSSFFQLVENKRYSSMPQIRTNGPNPE